MIHFCPILSYSVQFGPIWSICVCFCQFVPRWSNSVHLVHLVHSVHFVHLNNGKRQVWVESTYFKSKFIKEYIVENNTKIYVVGQRVYFHGALNQRSILHSFPKYRPPSPTLVIIKCLNRHSYPPFQNLERMNPIFMLALCILEDAIVSACL